VEVWLSENGAIPPAAMTNGDNESAITYLRIPFVRSSVKTVEEGAYMRWSSRVIRLDLLNDVNFSSLAARRMKRTYIVKPRDTLFPWATFGCRFHVHLNLLTRSPLYRIVSLFVPHDRNDHISGKEVRVERVSLVLLSCKYLLRIGRAFLDDLGKRRV
jgi:hypothetical protein